MYKVLFRKSVSLLLVGSYLSNADIFFLVNRLYRKSDNSIITTIRFCSAGRLVTCKPIVRCGQRQLRYVLILIMYATAFLLITVDDADGLTLRYVSYVAHPGGDDINMTSSRTLSDETVSLSLGMRVIINVVLNERIQHKTSIIMLIDECPSARLLVKVEDSYCVHYERTRVLIYL